MNPMLTTNTETDPLAGLPTVDAIEQELLRLEGLVSKVRARQSQLLGEIDRMQVPTADGTRSLKEWITGRLAVHPKTASDLAVLATVDHDVVRSQLVAGIWSTDRAADMQRLISTGAPPDVLDEAAGIPVSQLGRFTAQQRRMTPIEEQDAFEMRRLWIQPNLDHTLATGTITLSGADVDVLLQALDKRADELVTADDPHRPRLEQRRIDALVSLALDANLTPDTQQDARDDTDTPAPGSESGSGLGQRRLKAHIFVTADQAAATGGETGAITRTGIKIGPNTLEEILCVGETTTTLITPDGLYQVRTNGDEIPQRTRNYVYHRDNGSCTADGCTSRYRLEVHHILPRSQGGTHHPYNLTLLCWFHHHVVIHQQGHTINPNTPTHRRRFHPPNPTRAPPHH